MAECNDCNSLKNQDPTSIPLPEETNCPEDLGCIDVLPAHCISVTNVTDCITNGQNLQELINNIRSYICELSDGSGICKSKISIDDDCCDYLNNKFDSLTLDITEVTTSGCTKLFIEEPCWTWNTVALFTSGFTNLGGQFQTLEYSNVKACSVKLRGTVKKRFTQTCLSGTDVIFTLPVGFRPLKTRTYPVHIVKGGAACPIYSPIQLYINNVGQVSIFGTIPASFIATCAISLDGISWETT